MPETIFVGNLPAETSEQDIREMFSPYGEIRSVDIITNRKTGKSRGICFIEMDQEGAEEAISELNGKMAGERRLHVRYLQEEDGKDTSSF
ncbi:MAG: RNA-binding protein [Pseudomonadota bacterium]